MNESPPTVKWSFQTKGRLGRCSPALAADGTIFIGDHDCNLYALSGAGELRWRRRTAGRLGDATPSVTENGNILTVSETGRLYCFSASSDLLWSSTRNWLAITSPVTTADGLVIFSARRQNKAVGEHYRLMAVDDLGNEVWERAIQGDAGDAPVINSDGTIYVGTHKGYLYAISGEGDIKWQCRPGGRISSAPAITPEGTILIGTQDGRLYAVTPEMKILWAYPTGEIISHCSPVVAPDGTIYIGSWDHYLYALSTDGRLKWKFITGRPVAASPAVAMDGTVYFGSQDTHLYALRPDGQLKWQLQADSPFASSPVITEEGMVVICTQNRTVLALDEQNGGLASEGWPLLSGSPQRNGRQSVKRPRPKTNLSTAAGSRSHPTLPVGSLTPSSPLSTPSYEFRVDLSPQHRVRQLSARAARTRCVVC